MNRAYSSTNKQYVSLSTIIVTWNSENEIQQCLTSLINSFPIDKHQIVVVDNNSCDSTVNIVSKFKNVELIEEKTNWGFGQGNNIGLKHASGEYILLLNPDTKVNQNAINQMLNFLVNNPKVGAVGPEQLNEKGRLIQTLSRASLKGVSEYCLIRLGIKKIGGINLVSKSPYETRLLNLGCVMFNGKVFKGSIDFDAKFFLYGEEPDLFFRVRENGWKIYFMPNISIFHYRERSVGQTRRKTLYVIKSFSYLFVKRIKSALKRLSAKNFVERNNSTR